MKNTLLKNFFSKKIVVVFSIILLVLLVNFRAVFFDLTGFDDDTIINNIELFSKSNSLTDVFFKGNFFSEQAGQYYRPITSLSFYVDYIISAKETWAYHLTNIILHILSCIGFYFLLAKFNLKSNIASAILILFSINPIFVNSIYWIPARGDLLAACFAIYSLVFYLAYLNKKNNINLILYLISFALAIFSKEHTILLFILFIILNYINSKKLNTKFFNYDLFFNFIIWIFIIIFYIIVRTNILESIDTEYYGIMILLSNLATIPEFLFKLIFPFYLNTLPEFNLFVTIFGLCLLGISILLIIKDKNNILLHLFSLLWFVLFLLPSMLYRHPHGDTAFDYLENRVYFSAFGIILFLIQIVSSKAFEKISKKQIKIALVYSLFFVAYIINTFLYSNAYKDSLSFYNYPIERESTVALAYFNRGNIKKEISDYQGAINDFNKAIEIKPDYVECFMNRGYLRDEMGDYKYAIQDYSNAIEINPRYADAYNNRAFSKDATKDYDGAIKDYNEAIRINPNDPEFFNNRGYTKSKQGNSVEAINDYTQAINLKNQYDKAYNNRGLEKIKIGDINGAINDFNTAIKINSNYAIAYKNRGLAYMISEQFDFVCPDLKKSAMLGNKEALGLLKQYCR